MYIGKKYKIQPRGFRHRIRDNFGKFYDENHLLGIDPFDHTKFSNLYQPPVNIKENGKEYEIEIMIPGFTKDEVEISVVDNQLIITGNKESDITDDNQDYIHHEHVVNGFRREFYLNPETDSERIDARFEDGVLRIRLFKVEESQVDIKEIPVN